MEWFNIAWAWFKENIMPFLTAGNLALLLGVILKLGGQKRTLSDSILSSADVKQSLNSFTALSDELANIKTENSSLKALIGDLSDAITHLNNKANATLEIQQTAYNAAQNLSLGVKETINNLATNAKYSTTSARADILKQAEKIKDGAAQFAVTAAETVMEISKVVKSEPSKQIVM